MPWLRPARLAHKLADHRRTTIQDRTARRPNHGPHDARKITEGLGDVLMLRGQYDESANCFQAARELADGERSEAQIDCKLGELAFSRGDIPMAIEAIEQGLRRLGKRVPRGRPALFAGLLCETVVQALHTWFPGLFLGRRSLEHAEADLLVVRLLGRLAYAYWFGRGKVACLWAQFAE